MTPNNKIKFKETAQARALAVFSSADVNKRIDSAYYVEGYAAGYEPYVLYYDANGEPVYERFERGCFDNCDMSDVIMQYDHTGRVLARTGNGSLIVEVNERGLFCAADLSRTEAAKACYDDIVAGMVTKMSWRFRLGEYYYDPENRTIVHNSVKKDCDVAPVSIPANDTTEINARAWVDGEIARAARREAELDEQRRRLRIKIMNCIGGKNYGSHH